MQEDKTIDLFLMSVCNDTKETIKYEEKKINGKDYVNYGIDNRYPNYLLNLYNQCATLQSVINGTTDYIVGDAVIVDDIHLSEKVNNNGETMRDLLQKIALDQLIFGAFALHILRNYAGEVSEIYYVDVSKLRTDEKNEVFYYSDDWTSYRVKTLQYPKFNPNDKNIGSSIFYFKGNKTRNIYGTPMWSASAKNVEIDIAITDFHRSEIDNNFLGSKLISFNNGVPTEDVKNQIEKNLREKFSGAGNAGKIMISFAQSKVNAPVVTDLGTDNFDTRYETLEKRNKEQIFVAFRATPLLFGLVSESNGFATNEYKDSYKLFNKCVVKPMQDDIVGAINKIVGKEVVKIEPFTIKFEEDNEIKNDEL